MQALYFMELGYMDILDYYKKLVDFLGQVLGEDAEVVLRDCRKPDHDIVAIANGHVSGRTIGAPITDFTLSILASEQWKEKDFIVNYLGKTATQKRLRSSTFFIREEGRLVGELCINIDMTKYERLSREMLKLGGADLLPDNEDGPICGVVSEHFSNDAIRDLLEKAVMETMGSHEQIVRERLTQEDRIAILEMLDRSGLFHLKGAVSEAAKYLYCSEASIYRYLSKITKEKGQG